MLCKQLTVRLFCLLKISITEMKKITDFIYYVGVNDRHKSLFENMWPLPQGVSYNSYLIVDERTVLIDTVDIAYSDIFFRKLGEALNGRTLDYLVINHMEPDHSGSIGLLRKLYPEVRIVGNKQTFRMLEAYHGLTDGLHEVQEGESLSLGIHSLTFYMAPMVHWPEVMVAYESREGILFSADAFGTFGTVDGGLLDTQLNPDRYWDEMIRYYANIVGKYGSPVQRLLQKLATIDLKMICSTHGPVWQAHRSTAVDVYDRLSRYEGTKGVTIACGTMYGNTEEMADAIADALAANGIRDIVIHDTSKTHLSYILRDVFKYRGLILASATYSGKLMPGIDALLRAIEIREVRNRVFSYCGSFTWSGVIKRQLSAFAETMKWDVVGEPFEEKPAMTDATGAKCRALGEAVAALL